MKKTGNIQRPVLVRDQMGRKIYFLLDALLSHPEEKEKAEPHEKTEVIGWYAGKEIIRAKKLPQT